MIAKAKAISHGINDIRYITGESAKKKHPEKIYRILDNILPSHLDAMGIWNSMQLTLSRFKPIKNSVIRIELSPSVEHTRFFDIEDWQKLWQDFVAEFDKQVFTGKDGKVRSSQTNLANSKYSVWLHKESAGEVPHLHAAVCRLDEDGNINNDHNIHLRAQRAAERVAKKRGWTTAAEVRIANIHQVNRDCMSILKAMPKWSWENYKAALIQKGYTVHERLDKKGVIRGYVIRKGNAKYKASELGVARNLMASKLEHTWQKLHHQPNVAMNNIQLPALPTLADNRQGRWSIIPAIAQIRFLIPSLIQDKNSVSIFLKKCLNVSMMSLITEISRTVRNSPIWLLHYSSDCLKRPMLPLEAVVLKVIYLGEIKTRTICNGHEDALVPPFVPLERNLKQD